MPSPFPGMDPYLEGELWTTFHAQFVVQIARVLTARLRPRYVAFPQKTMIAGDLEDVGIHLEKMEPDVAIVRQSRGAIPVIYGVQVVEPPLQLRNRMVLEYPHFWVEIQEVPNRRLVTAIEFMSPANKHGRGRRQYLRKRQRILESTVHLVEIDLLRKGKRISLEEELPPADYFAFLSRANRSPMVEVWPIQIDQPLPNIPIPLKKKDKDVTLELQPVFAEIYDTSGYAAVIDYSQPPDVPLRAPLDAWAGQLLRQTKKRKRGKL